MNKFGISIAVLIAAFVGLIYMTAQNSEEERTVDQQEILAISEDDIVFGNRESDVVLIEFADYECPACRAYHDVVKQVIEQYGDRIAVVNRHFPLPFHQNARPAAWAVEAAGKQGQFEAMADLVFENQPVWSGKTANVALFYPYAEQLGLDMDQFMDDALSDEIKDKVDRQYREGQLLGVNSTPTFMLQGQVIVGMRSVEDFGSLIEQALEQAQEQAANTEQQVAETEEEVAGEESGTSTDQ